MKQQTNKQTRPAKNQRNEEKECLKCITNCEMKSQQQNCARNYMHIHIYIYAYIQHRKQRRCKKGGLLHWSAHKNHLKTAAKQTDRRRRKEKGSFPGFPPVPPDFPGISQAFPAGPKVSRDSRDERAEKLSSARGGGCTQNGSKVINFFHIAADANTFRLQATVGFLFLRHSCSVIFPGPVTMAFCFLLANEPNIGLSKICTEWEIRKNSARVPKWKIFLSKPK